MITELHSAKLRCNVPLNLRQQKETIQEMASDKNRKTCEKLNLNLNLNQQWTVITASVYAYHCAQL